MTERFRIDSLPHWGRAGVGASDAQQAAAPAMPQAPIPTFAQQGKEKLP